MRITVFIFMFTLLPAFAVAESNSIVVPPKKVEVGSSSSAPGPKAERLKGFKEMMKKGDQRPALPRAQQQIASQLNLTPAQQTKIDEIKTNSRKVDEQSASEMQSQQKKLRELMNATDFKEAEFRKTHQRLSKLQEDKQVNRAKMKMEIRKVLTPEQRVIYDKSQAEGRQRVFRLPGMMRNDKGASVN